MTRARRRSEKRRRHGDWPKTPEQELRDGVDLGLYQNKLARFFARFAPTAEDPLDDLRYARRIEDMDP